jgi:hypothetical protein
MLNDIQIRQYNNTYHSDQFVCLVKDHGTVITRQLLENLFPGDALCAATFIGEEY